MLRSGCLTLAMSALLVAGCGTSRSATVTQIRTTTVTAPAQRRGPPRGELLSVPAVGRLYGRCAAHASRWTITFVNDAFATDRVSYRVGSTRPALATVNPGQRLVWNLAPGRFTSREPADPASGFPAAAITTTEPLSLDITRATEADISRVTIRLAVAAAVGDTGNCALISSSLGARTMYPGGQPPN